MTSGQIFAFNSFAYQPLNSGGSKYDISIAGIYAALGKVYPEMGDYAHGLLYLNKALDLAKALSDQDTIANVLNSKRATRDEPKERHKRED